MIDFQLINREAMAVLPAVLRRLLPDGKIVSREFIARNPTRADKSAGSFKISLKSGKWADFATGDKGGDPISLVAFLENTSQGKAAMLLSQMLGIENDNHE